MTPENLLNQAYNSEFVAKHQTTPEVSQNSSEAASIAAEFMELQELILQEQVEGLDTDWANARQVIETERITPQITDQHIRDAALFVLEAANEQYYGIDVPDRPQQNGNFKHAAWAVLSRLLPQINSKKNLNKVMKIVVRQTRKHIYKKPSRRFSKKSDIRDFQMMLNPAYLKESEQEQASQREAFTIWQLPLRRILVLISYIATQLADQAELNTLVEENRGTQQITFPTGERLRLSRAALNLLASTIAAQAPHTETV